MNFDTILGNVSAVIKLTEEELSIYTSILEPRFFKKKEFVLRANETCRYQTYIISGCVKITFVDSTGAENIAKFAIEDWWAFDLQSFITQTPAIYSIQAIEDTETFQISKSNFDLLHEQVPKFEKFSRVMLQHSYISLQSRVTQNLSATADEKYQHFRQKYPGLELRISQKEIAAYLGITPEFLSMLRKKSMVS